MVRLYNRCSFRQTVHHLVDDDNDDDNDDYDDEVLDAAAAVVNASVYTPVYIIHIR